MIIKYFKFHFAQDKLMSKTEKQEQCPSEAACKDRQQACPCVPPKYEFPEAYSFLQSEDLLPVENDVPKEHLDAEQQAVVAQQQYDTVLSAVKGLDKDHPEVTVELAYPADSELLSSLVEYGYNVFTQNSSSYRKLDGEEPVTEWSNTLTVGLPGYESSSKAPSSLNVSRLAPHVVDLLSSVDRSLSQLDRSMASFVKYPSLFGGHRWF